MSNIRSGMVFLLNDGHGIYIPANFIECYCGESWNVTDDDKKELSSPDNQYYWETWESVLSYAIYKDAEGNKWHLYQDGDLYAVCYELLTDDEKQFIGMGE